MCVIDSQKMESDITYIEIIDVSIIESDKVSKRTGE